jgi:hypothetical protein
MMQVSRRIEQCGDCLPQRQCANHLACSAHRVRRPWPAFTGRCAEIAYRLVKWLADCDERRVELARIYAWRAGIRWEYLNSGGRDRPYVASSGSGTVLIPGPNSGV